MNQVDGMSILKPTRLELNFPKVDWVEYHRLARLPGLDSVSSSFLYRLLHQLLPTRDRVIRMGLDQPGQNVCQLCGIAVENLSHAFFECPKNLSSGNFLLTVAQKIVPELRPNTFLQLQFGHLTREIELAMMYLAATGLSCIWEARLKRSYVCHVKMRAELEAMVLILRKSRYCAAGDALADILN